MNSQTDNAEHSAELYGYITYIGMLTISWASIEKLMDNCIYQFYTSPGGSQLGQEKPISLKQKYRFLKQCAQKLPSLKAHKGALIELVRKTQPVGEKRHIFIHGCVDSWTKDSLTIRKLKSGHGYENEIFVFSLRDLQVLASSLQELAADWLLFAHQFLPPQSIPEWLERHRQLKPHLAPTR